MSKRISYLKEGSHEKNNPATLKGILFSLEKHVNYVDGVESNNIPFRRSKGANKKEV
jgi:hypothetical protein